MEILGGDDDRSGTRGRRPEVYLAPADAVHLDDDGALGSATEGGTSSGPAFAHALGAVLSPGSLGLAGIVVAAITAMGGTFSLTQTLHYAFSADSGPRDYAESLVTHLALGAVLTLCLGVAGVLRSAGVPPAEAGWGRACSGAATILGVLLLLLALSSFSQIGELPESYG